MKSLETNRCRMSLLKRKKFCNRQKWGSCQIFGEANAVCQGVYGLSDAGPPVIYKEKICFYISDPNSLLVSPALCAHSVPTLSKGTAMVTGSEALHTGDSRRIKFQITMALESESQH